MITSIAFDTDLLRTAIEFSSHRYDTFSDAPAASSAAEFGTQGVGIRAFRPLSSPGAVPR